MNGAPFQCRDYEMWADTAFVIFGGICEGRSFESILHCCFGRQHFYLFCCCYMICGQHLILGGGQGRLELFKFAYWWILTSKSTRPGGRLLTYLFIIENLTFNLYIMFPIEQKSNTKQTKQNFTANAGGITWKSAIMGNDDIETKRALPKDSISGALWTIFGKSGHLRLLTKPPAAGAATKLPAAMRFDGFPPSDYDSLNDAFNSMYGIQLKRHTMSSAGSSWGNTDISNRHLIFRQCQLEDADEEGEEFEPRDGDEMASLDLGEVSQCVLPGNNRNEIEMQFLESDTVEAGTDQLVAIRFYVPPDADADPTDKDAPTSAEVLQSEIMQIASVKKTSGSVIAEFDETKGTFLTPRGRYSVELYDSFMRMRGAKYDYKIKYDDISRLFLLPKQDDLHMAFVIALDKPIRQGQQVS